MRCGPDSGERLSAENNRDRAGSANTNSGLGFSDRGVPKSAGSDWICPRTTRLVTRQLSLGRSDVPRFGAGRSAPKSSRDAELRFASSSSSSATPPRPFRADCNVLYLARTPSESCRSYHYGSLAGDDGRAR